VTSSTAWNSPVSVRGGAAVTIVLAASALTGILTPLGEQMLPHAIRSMANSSGPWALVAFAAIYLSGLRGWRAAALGAAAFLTMDLSFYVVFESLGLFYPLHFLAFWMLVAVAVGPIVGLSAAWLRSPQQTLRAVAVSAAPAVLVGEGVFMLVRLPGESTVYAIASLVIGVMLFVVSARLLLRSARTIILSISIAVAAGFAFFFVYGLIPLLLDKVVP
jgi:hypothetical protein